ncbi:hypothetical protein [Streptomyces sp. S.PNR 29]|uniref:hypothetical protein n=1 Tax=Streptomyces sp. S.PNR 29 TaxID=2973805 RepID=UPI0025AF63E0|nr:hypothetical protein [Streptomyces sp. S.PNR 29]MDN0200698.1 hypothetical protein [Streptomyces sp. S.PNR 29]
MANRTMTAAKRAAAKRAQRAEHPRQTGDDRPEEQRSGPAAVIEARNGWDDPPEPSPKSPEPAETPLERPRRRLYTLVLALVLVAGLVAVAVLGWQYREGRRAQDARDQALTAARQAAPVVLSYDYRHLDRDFARARTHLTGKFRDEYAKTTRTVVAPTAKKYHGVVKATVVEPPGGGAPAASVVSASPDRVVVLLFVNQVTRSTQVSGPRLDLNRVRMTLTRTAESWKVSAVDAL